MNFSGSSSGSIPYGYGRLGVLQQSLLHGNDIERLIGAQGESQIVQSLTETPFTRPIMPVTDLHDVVPAMEQWLKAQLVDMTGDASDVFNILWLKEDASVIAHLLKERLGLSSGLMSIAEKSITAYPLADLQAEILQEGQRNLPEDVAHFLEEMKKKTHLSPADIDREVASFIALKQIEIAEKSGNTLITQYVRHTIDIQNIRTVRRLPEDMVKDYPFLQGGEINPRRLTGNLTEMAMLIHASSLPNTLASGMNEQDSSIMLEKALAKALAHDVAAMRSSPLSIAPIFAYAITALSHIIIIRTILMGKSARLTSDEIRSMLPPIFSTSFQNA